MGWLQDILGVAAPVVGGLLGGPAGAALGGAVGGAVAGGGGSKQTGAQTTTTQQQVDPRIGNMLFGGNGNAGLLNQYQSMLGKPQNAGLQSYGNLTDWYLGNNAQKDLGTLRDTALAQTQGNLPSPTMQGAQVNAPGQNAIDLTGSYNKFIYGNPAENPYLTNAIGGALQQSTNQFQQMQNEATNNLMRNIMPSIRSGSVLAGQYGGSRQGVAEGNAISDFTKQQQQAATQFGQGNTNAAVNAQAQAYSQGLDRALAATQGLGGQQYGVASQDAAARQAADIANINAKLSTNALGANVQQQGISNLGGLLGSAYNVGQNQDQYALNQAGKVNSLIAPYLSTNASSTTSQPLYQNTMGNILGGATAGLGIAKQIGGLLGGTSNTTGAGTGNYGGGPPGTYFDGYSWVPTGT